jgi:FkbH-like protein
MTDDLRDRLAAATDRDSLLASVADRLPRSLTTREAERIARRQKELAPIADLRLLLLGNHTLDGLARATAAATLCRGVVTDAKVGPFDQHMQMLLDPSHGLDEIDPQAIFLSLDLERLLPALPAGITALPTEGRRRLVDQGLEAVAAWVEFAKTRTTATLLVGNFWRPHRPHLGLADAKLVGGEAALYGLLNARLIDTYAEDSRVYVVDVDHEVASVGRDLASDPRMKFLAKLAWSEAVLPTLGHLLAGYVAGLVLPPKKCLVLDLDNTLWGGVLGEEGPDGIRIAEGDPVGEAFRAFQTAIKGVQQRGILLAACSKNNPGDVEEVFRLRPDMPLGLKDFVAKRINWEPKHQSIQAIAAELNIGTDSLVFVDDNPAECELVRQMLPEVEVIHLPKDPARYAGLLLDLPSLERLEVAAEDSRKTEQYQEQAEREAARATVGDDMQAYLASLGTEATIWPATRAEATRVHQLFAKTNQFNLTTKRYKPADIEGFMASPDWQLEVVSAKDRFGDLGIIAALLLERRGPDLALDSLVMSCRAMSRSIETVIANRIKAIARAEQPQGRLLAEFRPTAKNKPASDYLERQGLKLVHTDDDGNRHYALAIADAADQPAPEITVHLPATTPRTEGARTLEPQTG